MLKVSQWEDGADIMNAGRLATELKFRVIIYRFR